MKRVPAMVPGRTHRRPASLSPSPDGTCDGEAVADGRRSGDTEMMDYETFLNRVIDDGIAAAKTDYAHDDEKREGAVAGFEACRGKAPAKIIELLAGAARAAHEARRSFERTGYWRARCYELEIGWVANVVSAALVNEGKAPIVSVTARGMMKAADILGGLHRQGRQ